MERERESAGELERLYCGVGRVQRVKSVCKLSISHPVFEDSKPRLLLFFWPCCGGLVPEENSCWISPWKREIPLCLPTTVQGLGRKDQHWRSRRDQLPTTRPEHREVYWQFAYTFHSRTLPTLQYNRSNYRTPALALFRSATHAHYVTSTDTAISNMFWKEMSDKKGGTSASDWFKTIRHYRCVGQCPLRAPQLDWNR